MSTAGKTYCLKRALIVQGTLTIQIGNNGKGRIPMKKKKPTRRNTEIVRTKYYTFPIGSKLKISYAEACTSRGVKLFAFTRQSILDKDDPSLTKQVLDGRLEAALRYYKTGKAVRGMVAYAGMIPTKSSAVERGAMTKRECVEEMKK
jgi:hypothetical protein